MLDLLGNGSTYKYYDKNLKTIDDNLYISECNNDYCDVYKSLYEHYLYKDGKKHVDFIKIKY